MGDEKAVAKTPEYTTPGALLQIAIQKDFDIERLSKLMELQERWEKNEARKAYFAAMTAFKKNPPQIIKDMHVEYQSSKGKTSYRHASLGNVVGTITQALSDHDLSANWKTETNGKVRVTCTVSHVLGYSESTTIEAGPDISGGKNAIQAIGSTITYLQCYTLLAICGLATNEFEDDGRSSDAMPPNLQKLASELGKNKAELKRVGADAFLNDAGKLIRKNEEISESVLQDWILAMKEHLTREAVK